MRRGLRPFDRLSTHAYEAHSDHRHRPSPPFFSPGCEALQEERQNFLDREEKITNVVGNVWRIEPSGPDTSRATASPTTSMNAARMHCDRQHMAMLPVNGSSTNGKKDGSRPASAWLEFRCQPGLDYRPEYKGLTGTFEIDDLTTLENTQGK